MTNDSQRSQFKKISTGNGFQNDLIATTNDRLEMTIIELQNLQHAITSQFMFLQSDIEDLEKTIKKANNENMSLQNKFLWLALVATAFAILQGVQVVDILARGIGK